MTRTVQAMVAEARNRIENLEPDRVAAELERGVVLIDIREEDELAAHGWIADSVWAPRGMLEFWADPSCPYHRPEFEPNHRTILYCASGGRSALAAAMLRRMGYRDVAHLDGGLTAWEADGREVERPPSRNGPAHSNQ